jgi:hypothetical protein
MLQDPEVARWNPAPAVVDARTAREWCARNADWSDGTHATWHAIDHPTGRLVAACQVAGIVAGWSFAGLGLARIQLEHAVANVGSCRVASRAGFVLEGTLRSASRDGLDERHDDHVHGRLATDPVVSPPVAYRH